MVAREDGEVIESASDVTHNSYRRVRFHPFGAVESGAHTWTPDQTYEQLGLVFEPLAEAVLHAL
jgi:hypothetical protein